jgi:hypothetical protein
MIIAILVGTKLIFLFITSDLYIVLFLLFFRLHYRGAYLSTDLFVLWPVAQLALFTTVDLWSTSAAPIVVVSFKELF